MAETHDFTIDKGATFRANILYQDDSGTAINLTGYTASMQIRRTYKGSVIHSLTTENGGIAITPLNGELDLLIEADDTDAFPALMGRYDLEITSGTEVTRILEGRAIIKENVTR